MEFFVKMLVPFKLNDKTNYANRLKIFEIGINALLNTT